MKLLGLVNLIIDHFTYSKNMARADGYNQAQIDIAEYRARSEINLFVMNHPVGNVFISVTPSVFDVVVVTGHHENRTVCFTKSLLTEQEQISFGKLVRYTDNMVDALAKLDHHERYLVINGIKPVRTDYSLHYDIIDVERIKSKVAEYTNH